MSDHQLRFGGIERLYGNTGSNILQHAHFCVIGIGGVGSWAAEALARNGVGTITLIDLDDICLTNINRQIHALTNTVGLSKVEVMAQRIQEINPECVVNIIEDFLTPENINSFIRDSFDYVIDAIDSVNVKTKLIAHCKRKKISIITIGGAGGKIDPSQIEICDLSQTFQDPLLSKVRNQLRREHNYSRNVKRKFSIDAVFSKEQLLYPDGQGNVSYQKPNQTSANKLDCNTGFGSTTHVTATFAFFAVSKAIKKLINRKINAI